jgi:hypothetical protein
MKGAELLERISCVRRKGRVGESIELMTLNILPILSPDINIFEQELRREFQYGSAICWSFVSIQSTTDTASATMRRRGSPFERSSPWDTGTNVDENITAVQSDPGIPATAEGKRGV